MRAFLTTDFTVKRLAYDEDVKGSYASAGSGVGHLKQLDEQNTALNNLQYGQGFNLFVEDGIDIEAGDKVVADGVEFEVRGVRVSSFGGINFKKVLIVKNDL